MNTELNAPASIAGKTYTGTIVSGAGDFASSGIAKASFSSDGAYTITQIGGDVSSSSGTYSYSVIDRVGIVEIADSSLGNATYRFTFTSATTGTYTATSGSSRQTGTFTEMM